MFMKNEVCGYSELDVYAWNVLMFRMFSIFFFQEWDWHAFLNEPSSERTCLVGAQV